MQYTIHINQVKALEWGLNSQQAMLFAFVYECPSWCNSMVQGGKVFYTLSKAKVMEELPLLTNKPDTVYRMLKALQAKGLVVLSSTNQITLVRLTDKAKEWNHKASETPEDGSEKYPSKDGKKSEMGRKKIRNGSEKYPTNQGTNYQVTNDQDQLRSPAKKPAANHASDQQFESVWQQYPKREGSNPKNHALSAWKARIAEGHKPEDMLAGLMRYLAYCQAKGSIGTSFVMQAKRFFGPSLEFTNDWAVSQHQGRTDGGMVDPDDTSWIHDDWGY